MKSLYWLFCFALDCLLHFWGQIPIAQWLCQCERQGSSSGALGFCIFAFVLFNPVSVSETPQTYLGCCSVSIRSGRTSLFQEWSYYRCLWALGLTQSLLEPPGIFLFIFESPQTRSLRVSLGTFCSGWWKLESSDGWGDRAVTKAPCKQSCLELTADGNATSTVSLECTPPCRVGGIPSLQGLHASQPGIRVKSATRTVLVLSTEVFLETGSKRECKNSLLHPCVLSVWGQQGSTKNFGAIGP